MAVEDSGKLQVAGGLTVIALSILLLPTIFIIIVVSAQKRRPRRHAGAEGTGPFPPGPPAWPIIGHLPLLRIRPHQALANLCTKHGYGPIVGLRLGSRRAVVVSSAAIAKDLFLTHDKAFANRVHFLFSDTVFYGYGSAVIFSAYTPRWAWLRKIYTLELLTAKRLDELRYVRHDELRRLLRRLRDCSDRGAAVNLGSFLAEMNADVMSRLVHSKTLREATPELPELMRAIQVEAFPTLGDFIPSLSFLDAIPKWRMKRLHRRIDRALDSILRERRRLMAELPPDQLPHDFLQVILGISKEKENEGDECITSVEMKAIMLDMFLAGIDTTTSTLEWAMAEVLKNQELFHKLHDDVNKATKDNKGVILDDEETQNMPYLDNVVKEVLRLHPVVPLLIPRISNTECKVGDYTLPKGTHAFVNVWAIARDPTIWDRPEYFSPERFEVMDMDVKGQHYELLPFGSGRRMCAGMRLGMSTVSVTLANLVKFFDWQLPLGQSHLSIDMTENSGLGSSMASPMLVIPKLRSEFLDDFIL